MIEESVGRVCWLALLYFIIEINEKSANMLALFRRKRHNITNKIIRKGVSLTGTIR
jgi:hypothetical protein